MRLYFSTTPVRSPLERPSKLQLVHARLPPGFAPSATSQRPSQVHAAFYRQGTLQTYWFCQGMTCSQVENDLLLVSDSGNRGKKNQSPLTEVKLVSCWWLHGSKKVLSDSPGLADHLAGHLTFKSLLAWWTWVKSNSLIKSLAYRQEAASHKLNVRASCPGDVLEFKWFFTPSTSPDALLLSYTGLMGALTIKLGSCDTIDSL